MQETAKGYACCVEEPESETSLKVLCEPVSGYDEFLFYFLFFYCFFVFCFLESSLNIKFLGGKNVV